MKAFKTKPNIILGQISNNSFPFFLNWLKKEVYHHGNMSIYTVYETIKQLVRIILQSVFRFSTNSRHTIDFLNFHDIKFRKGSIRVAIEAD